MKGYAFITGASAGFGEAIAETLANEGYQLIIAARRTERLEELKSRLRPLNIDVQILTMDVRNESEVIAAVASLPENIQKQIEILHFVKNKIMVSLQPDLLPKTKFHFEDRI